MWMSVVVFFRVLTELNSEWGPIKSFVLNVNEHCYVTMD